MTLPTGPRMKACYVCEEPFGSKTWIPTAERVDMVYVKTAPPTRGSSHWGAGTTLSESVANVRIRGTIYKHLGLDLLRCVNVIFIARQEVGDFIL
jgi:hypothetical protein